MDFWGNWITGSSFYPRTSKEIDPSVSTAQIGDLIEFANPWLGLSLWAVYAGEGHVIHFGVGDENMTQQMCRSFAHWMIPKSSSSRVLKTTRICTQRISDIRVPQGTQIRVNNSKHSLDPSPQELMMQRCGTFLHQEFKYDLVNFNSEHFATFVRFGEAVCNQVPFKKKNKAHKDTTQTLEMIIQQRAETEI